MKKLLPAILLTFSLTSASYAENFLDYVGVGVALQDVDNPNIDNGTAVVLNGGKTLFQGLGLEFEGTASIQKMEGTLNDVKKDVDFWSLGMYSTYIWKLGNLSVKPRIGLVYESIQSDLSLQSDSTDATDKNDLGLSAGIGFAYQLGTNYNIYTNYTRIEDDIDHLTFGAEYKF